jgi:hypothetical protein
MKLLGDMAYANAGKQGGTAERPFVPEMSKGFVF